MNGRRRLEPCGGSCGCSPLCYHCVPRPSTPHPPRTHSSPRFSFSNDNVALSKDPTLPNLIFWQYSKCKLLFKQTKTPKHFVLIFADNNT